MKTLSESEKSKIMLTGIEMLRNTFDEAFPEPHVAVLDGESSEPALYILKVWASKEDCLAGLDPHIEVSAMKEELTCEGCSLSIPSADTCDYCGGGPYCGLCIDDHDDGCTEQRDL